MVLRSSCATRLQNGVEDSFQDSSEFQRTELAPEDTILSKNALFPFYRPPMKPPMKESEVK